MSFFYFSNLVFYFRSMMAEKPMEKDDKDNRKEFLEISGDGSKSLSSLCIY